MSLPMDYFSAANLGEIDIVRKHLQDNSEDLNKKNLEGWTTLMYSSFKGHENVASLLLELGADVHIKNKVGCNALILSSLLDKQEVAHLLLKAGADVTVIDDNGKNALFYAAERCFNDLLTLLADNGCDVNLKDKRGLTPLTVAASRGLPGIVKILLDKGACPLIVTSSGQSAKSLATENGHTEIVAAIETHFAVHQTCCNNPSNHDSMTNLSIVLTNLGLTKYYSHFEKNSIDFKDFWNLTEDDLKKIGIMLLGPRKKIMAEIRKWNENKALSMLEKLALLRTI